jgi:uncharacterized protein (DUF983 family)
MPDRPTATETSASAWGQLWALLRLRCPRCRRGRMFHSLFGMNDPCPECGLIFQREEGYFLGAMYVSYALAAILMSTGFLLGQWLLPGWHDHAILVCLLLLYVPLTPAVFRYSRAVWIYVDRLICPGGSSAGAFEKAQARKAGHHPGVAPSGNGSERVDPV